MNLENILRRITLVGIFVLPFIPFIVFSNLFFPFITGKNFAFRILVELLFAVWIALAYINVAYRPRKSPILWALSAFVGIMFLADLFGANHFKSFWSNYERMEGFVALAHLFLYFIVTTSVLSTQKLWERFFQMNVFASVIMSIYGFLQLSGSITINQGGARLDGTFGNAAYLAVYMMWSFFLTAFLFARHRGHTSMRWVYGIAMILQLAILYFTETRGTILGVLAGIFIASALTALFERKNKTLRKVALGGILTVLVLIGGFFAIKNTEFVRNHGALARLASISLSADTTNARFMVWGMAIKGWEERPILGWGQEGFNFVFNKYYNPGMYAQEQWFDRAHNIFFDWLVAGGALGLLSYLSLFFFALWYIWKIEESDSSLSLLGRIKHWFANLAQGDPEKTRFTVAEKSILTGLLVAYFIHNFFVFDNLWSYVLFISLLGYLHHCLTEKERGEIAPSNNVPDGVIAVGAITVLALGVIMYFVNVRPILANLAIIDGFQPNQDLTKNIAAFERAISYNTFGTSEAREQLAQNAIRAKDSSIPQDIVQKFFDAARKQVILQTEEFPGDARNESFAALLFSRFGMYDEALAHLEKAHQLSPKKQSLYFDMINAYLGKHDADRALQLAKEAHELEPRFEQATKIYAITAIYAGDEKLSDQILMENFGTTMITEDDFVNAYASVGNFHRAVTILEAEVAKDPQNVELRVRLAAGYLQLGRKKDAIAQIRQAEEINPQIKDQAEAYIKQIQSAK